MSDELKYLDSDLKYSVPKVSPRTYHVSLDSTSLESEKHITLAYTNNNSDYIAGETVSINCDRGNYFGEDLVGWYPKSETCSDHTKLNDRKSFTPYEPLLTYEFAMPDYDVTVYAYCPGNYHSAPE